MSSLLKSVWVRIAPVRSVPSAKPSRSRPPLHHLTAHGKPTRRPVGPAAGVKSSTAGTPPSRPSRKAHSCSLTGGMGGVSSCRTEAQAEDAHNALTLGASRSYPRGTHRSTSIHGDLS